MPNISEIPTHEILDSPSSSQPSDDCNANACCSFDDNLTTHAIYDGFLDHRTTRDDSPLLSSDERRNNIQGATFQDDDDDYNFNDSGADLRGENIISNLDMDDDNDYFEDSEYVGDSEYAENEEEEADDLPPSYADHPKYEQLLQDFNETYVLPGKLQVHPDEYLPGYFTGHGLDIDPLTEDEAEKLGIGGKRSKDKRSDSSNRSSPTGAGSGDHQGGRDRRDSEDRPLEVLRPPAEFMTPGYDISEPSASARTSFMDDMSMSVGFTSNNASCSDISGLCEIDDSEINNSDDDSDDDENTPLHVGELSTRV